MTKLLLLLTCEARRQGEYWLNQCAVGFSGVVFALIVLDNARSGVQRRSIFGLLSVPAPLYPWALLVLWQLLLPGVSFLGHLGELSRLAAAAETPEYIRSCVPVQAACWLVKPLPGACARGSHLPRLSCRWAWLLSLVSPANSGVRCKLWRPEQLSGLHEKAVWC